MIKISADAAKLAGLQIDILQKLRNNEQITLEHLEWFSKLTKEQRDKLTGNTADNRFKLLNTFELTVPEDYKHESQLASFKQENRDKFWDYNDNITDMNFAKVTDKLMPGKTYEGRVYQITKPISSEDALAFLKMQPRIMLVGAQGISLARQLKKEEFLVSSRWVVISLDNKDALWKDADGYHGVPSVYRFSDGDWSFDLVSFEGDWSGDVCLVCFCDLPK